MWSKDWTKNSEVIASQTKKKCLFGYDNVMHKAAIEYKLYEGCAKLELKISDVCEIRY